METQVQRVITWREQKRRQDYQPLTIWLKSDVKHMTEDLAAQRRQDLKKIITLGILALKEEQSKRVKSDQPDYPLLRRLIDERLAVQIPAYVQQMAADATPATSPEALAALPPLGSY